MERFTDLGALMTFLKRVFALLNPEIAAHHRKVARLSRAIADILGLPIEKKQTIITAALMHDVCALANSPVCIPPGQHDGTIGYMLPGADILSEVSKFRETSDVIKYHCVPWNLRAELPSVDGWIISASQIIYLADNVMTRSDSNEHILSAINLAKEYVMEQRNVLFQPNIADAFLRVCDQEALWLDMVHEPPLHSATEDLALEAVAFSLDETLAIAQVFSQIIDFCSPYTARHSAGVAAVATKLAELKGFSENECKMIMVAGSLHDIGKLAVPVEILEKRGKLDPAEYDIVRSHAYHTYRVLYGLNGFEEIAQWAGFHHERLNGKGYPFGLDEQSLSVGSQILEVADVFSALREDRPYRPGMTEQEVISILKEMVNDGELSASACSLVIENFGDVDYAREEAMKKAPELSSPNEEKEYTELSPLYNISYANKRR